MGKETEKRIMASDEDFYGKFYLRDGKKEDTDFKVVDKQVWDKLFSKYGGRELRRKSICVPTDNPQRPDFIVEVQLRRFKIITWPRVKYFPTSLSQDIYCSRTDTVKELISQICWTEEAGNIGEKMNDELT